MSDRIIKVAEFSRSPGGRYKARSSASGEEFRDKFLVPNIRNGKKIRVELDGVRGYGSSFLEEAFGGLVRKFNWKTIAEVDNHIEVSSTTNPSWKQEVDSYMRSALNHG
jgi:hypothetical protein